jgi:uncharacterized spore protein YtfJ
MSEKLEKFAVTSLEEQEQVVELVEQLFSVAQPGAVFGEPVTSEEHTIITACEVKVGMGFGYGSGGGSGTGPIEGEEKSEEGAEIPREGTGYGSGGGGGGVSGGRPVAVIEIGPHGVQVEPVVDVTKIALAFFTTLGSMFFMLNKMRKASMR